MFNILLLFVLKSKKKFKKLKKLKKYVADLLSFQYYYSMRTTNKTTGEKKMKRKLEILKKIETCKETIRRTTERIIATKNKTEKAALIRFEKSLYTQISTLEWVLNK